MNGLGNSSQIRINYLGPSMNPTLKGGDVLSVAPYGRGCIQAGDIIAFYPPQGTRVLVHRVVRLGPEGVYTRGDDNRENDPWVLHPDQIIGRVVSLQRKNRCRSAAGGLAGRMRGMGLNILKQLSVVLSQSLHPVYHRLAASGIFQKCLPRSLRPGIVIFRKPAGEEMLLTWGRRKKMVVGRWRAGQEKWQIRRPFRLFVNEAVITEILKDSRGKPLRYS
jgi:hypothetical protein